MHQLGPAGGNGLKFEAIINNSNISDSNDDDDDDDDTIIME